MSDHQVQITARHDEINGLTASSSKASWQVRDLLIVLGVAAGMILVWRVREVLLVVFGGVLLAVFLCGLTKLVIRYASLPRGVALGLVLCVLLALMIGGTWFLGSDLLQQFGDLRQGLMAGYAQLDKQLAASRLGEYWKSLRESARPSSAQVTALAGYVSSGLGALAIPLVILVLGLFLSIDPQLYQRGALLLAPPGQRARGRDILQEAGNALWGWLWGRAFSMSLIGVATFFGLWLLGIPIALSLALIAFATNFIPYIGPFVSAIPAVLIAFTVSPMHAVYVTLLYAGIQLVETHFITPLIEQQAVNLPPALTISAQMISAVLLGPLGIVFATPLAAVAVVMIKVLYIRELPSEQPAADSS